MTEAQMKALGTDDVDWKQNFGEMVYMRVTQSGHSEEDSGKITGILIDQESSALAEMVSTDASLREKISEAYSLVKETSQAQ